MKKSISFTTNIKGTSIVETVSRKESTRNDIKKQAARKYGVHETEVTITSIENVVEGLYTATATVNVTLKMFLTYVFTSPAQWVKVYGSILLFLIASGVCLYNHYSLWCSGALLILMWPFILKGSWNNYNGKEF
jgi:hypothetical protein